MNKSQAINTARSVTRDAEVAEVVQTDLGWIAYTVQMQRPQQPFGIIQMEGGAVKTSTFTRDATEIERHMKDNGLDKPQVNACLERMEDLVLRYYKL